MDIKELSKSIVTNQYLLPIGGAVLGISTVSLACFASLFCHTFPPFSPLSVVALSGTAATTPVFLVGISAMGARVVGIIYLKRAKKESQDSEESPSAELYLPRAKKEVPVVMPLLTPYIEAPPEEERQYLPIPPAEEQQPATPQTPPIPIDSTLPPSAFPSAVPPSKESKQRTGRKRRKAIPEYMRQQQGGLVADSVPNPRRRKSIFELPPPSLETPESATPSIEGSVVSPPIQDSPFTPKEFTKVTVRKGRGKKTKKPPATEPPPKGKRRANNTMEKKLFERREHMGEDEEEESTAEGSPTGSMNKSPTESPIEPVKPKTPAPNPQDLSTMFDNMKSKIHRDPTATVRIVGKGVKDEWGGTISAGHSPEDFATYQGQ